MQSLYSNKIITLTLFSIISLGSSCQWLSTQIQTRSFGLPFKAHSQTDIQALPPVSLKVYQVTEYDYQVVSKIESRDKHGHQRLQLVIHTHQDVQEDFFWHLINKNRFQFQVIWFQICSPKQNACSDNSRKQQAAWFASNISANEHHLLFTPHKMNQNLYLSQ